MYLTYIIAIIHKVYGAYIKPANACPVLTPSVSGNGLSSGTEVGKLAIRVGILWQMTLIACHMRWTLDTPLWQYPPARVLGAIIARILPYTLMIEFESGMNHFDNSGHNVHN